jgi:hypothetical protein
MQLSKRNFLAAALLVILFRPLHVKAQSLRATIVGSGGPSGRCTIQLSVDGSAEVEVSGDTGHLTTLTGQNADWRRFQCNGALPQNPADFRRVQMAGRGSVRLLRDPRRSGGSAVVRIDDPQSGHANYTFDLQWSDRQWGGRGGYGGGPGWQPAPSPQLPPPAPWAGLTAKAVEGCKNSVAHRLSRDGYRYVTLDRVAPDNRSGPGDWVIGSGTGKRGFETRRFSFSCSVDFRSGRVRSADVRDLDARNQWR